MAFFRALASSICVATLVLWIGSHVLGSQLRIGPISLHPFAGTLVCNYSLDDELWGAGEWHRRSWISASVGSYMDWTLRYLSEPRETWLPRFHRWNPDEERGLSGATFELPLAWLGIPSALLLSRRPTRTAAARTANTNSAESRGFIWNPRSAIAIGAFLVLTWPASLIFRAAFWIGDFRIDQNPAIISVSIPTAAADPAKTQVLLSQLPNDIHIEPVPPRSYISLQFCTPDGIDFRVDFSLNGMLGPLVPKCDRRSWANGQSEVTISWSVWYLVGVGAYLIYRGYKRCQLEKRAAIGACQNCGYPLGGVSPTSPCPECGRKTVCAR